MLGSLGGGLGTGSGDPSSFVPFMLYRKETSSFSSPDSLGDTSSRGSETCTLRFRGKRTPAYLVPVYPPEYKLEGSKNARQEFSKPRE